MELLHLVVRGEDVLSRALDRALHQVVVTIAKLGHAASWRWRTREETRRFTPRLHGIDQLLSRALLLVGVCAHELISFSASSAVYRVFTLSTHAQVLAFAMTMSCVLP